MKFVPQLTHEIKQLLIFWFVSLIHSLLNNSHRVGCANLGFFLTGKNYQSLDLFLPSDIYFYRLFSPSKLTAKSNRCGDKESSFIALSNVKLLPLTQYFMLSCIKKLITLSLHKIFQALNLSRKCEKN